MYCETEIRGKFVRRNNGSRRPKLTFDDDKGKEHKGLPFARMLSKIGCRSAKVSEAKQRIYDIKILSEPEIGKVQ